MLGTRAQQLIESIELNPIDATHIEDIAKLHFSILPWSFNGQFGQAHIIDLYQALYKSPHFFGYVYYSENELLGFVTATANFEDTRNRVLSVFKSKAWKTLKIFMRQPRFFLTALESKFLVPMIFRRFACKAEWLTFVTATNKNYLTPLIAMRMIEQVHLHFRELGVDAYMAQGFKDNPRAIKLYEKLKWRIVARLPMHNIYYYPTGRAASASATIPDGSTDDN